MAVERCVECGFDAEEWTNAECLSTLQALPARFVDATGGLSSEQLLRRPVEGRWSIAEYVDHVREVLFGMRFVLDSLIAEPGTDLGEAPSSTFQPEPRQIDIVAALDGIDNEGMLLVESLEQLSVDQWHVTLTFDGSEIDAGWIVRHAVHDSTHHLLDVEHLRRAL